MLISCKSYTDISLVKSSEAPDGYKEIFEIMSDRILQRLPNVTQKNILSIEFRIDNSLQGDSSVVHIHNGHAVICGGRTRALLFGGGELMRQMKFYEKHFKINDGNYQFFPTKRFRQCYIARHFDNWYHRAPNEEMLKYIEDLALWGINAFHMHLDYPMVDLEFATEIDLRVFDSISRSIANRVHELDLILTTIGGENVAPGNMPPSYKAVPNEDPKRGDTSWNVCPEKFGALDYLLNLRKRSLDAYADINIDGFVYWPYDEGGCACEQCRPWGGNGYVRLMEKMSKINKNKYPESLQLVSTWAFNNDDWELFYKYLKTQDWIDCLIVDSHEDFPNYPLEHAVPNNIPIITFPEISMWGRYPWGGFGAIVLLERFERLFRQVEHIVDGFQLYSEGLFEDLNKVIVTGLYTNPSCQAEDIIKRYVQYELPGINAEDFIKFVHILETTHQTRIPGRGLTKGNYFSNYIREANKDDLKKREVLSAQAADLARRMDKQILPSMRNCWRWRLLFLRALIDEEIYASRKIHSCVLDNYYKELTSIYHSDIQEERVLAGKGGGHTCPPVGMN